MFCTNCGSVLEDGVSFCTNCGAPLKKAAPQPVQVEIPIETEGVAAAGAPLRSAPVQQFETPASQELESQPAPVYVQDTMQQTTFAQDAVNRPAAARDGVVPYAEVKAAQGKKSNSGKILGIVGGLAVVAIAAIVIGMNMLGNSSAPSASSGASPVLNPPAVTVPSISAPSVNVPSIGAPSVNVVPSGAAPAVGQYAPECLDAYGNVTLYAISELDGQQIIDLLEQNGYTYDFLFEEWNNVNGAAFGVLDDNGEGDDEVVRALPKGGQGERLVWLVDAYGYKSPEDMLRGQPLVVEAQYDIDDELVAVVYGPSMKRYVVLAVADVGGVNSMAMFTEEALESGMFMDLLTDGENTMSLTIPEFMRLMES